MPRNSYPIQPTRVDHERALTQLEEIVSDAVLVTIALLTFQAWQRGITGYRRLAMRHPVWDIFGESHSARLASIRRRRFSTWTIPLALTSLGFALTPWWGWSHCDPDQVLRPVLLSAAGIVTWRAVTMDIDLATGRTFVLYRGLMFLAWMGAWVHPAFLVLLLHIGITWLRSSYHHQFMALRVILIFLAGLGALPLTELITRTEIEFTTPALFLLLLICASHYLVPGIGKLRLGRHWYSWIRDNRLHSIVIVAHLKGWLGFLPAKRVIGVVRLLRPLDSIFQLGTVLIELGSAFILFDQRICVILLGCFVVFHLMVAISTGIFFWQFVVVDALLFTAIFNLPPRLAADLFGWQSGSIAAALLLVFPLRGKIWRPNGLSWWDTPFCCGVDYEAKGRESGVWYALHNDFMCPHERIFGQQYGEFLSNAKRLNGHIGETTDRACREAILDSGEDVSRIATAKEELGTSLYDAELGVQHDRYFTAFLRNFNAGRRKRVCPVWLKAPGGQLFYWGTLPRFTGQEPIAELVVRYREQYFDGERIHEVTNEIVREYSTAPG